MDRRLIRNYIYNIAYQLVKIVLPLVIVPYTYAHLTAPVLGISDFAGSIINWFILFGILGVNTYGNREIAKVRNHPEDLNRTFFEIFFMQVTDMVIAAIAYFIFIRFTVHEHLLIYELTGVTMLASMLDITWFFYGVEDFKKASIRNIIVKILGVSLIMLLCRKPEDLWKYVLINSGSELVGQGIMFVQLRQYISFQKVSLKDAYRHHFKATIQLFIPTIAISVYTMLDQTMLGYLYNETHLEYYKTAMSFVKMFLYFITSIGAVMLPRVTNVYYNDSDGAAKAQGYVNVTMKIVLMLAFPLCFGLIAVASDFIAWYLPSAPIIAQLIRIGAPIVIAISMSNVTGIQYMVPTGMYNQYSASVIAGACINFVFNSLLIPGYGAFGAIVGSLIAEFSVTLIQYLYVRKKVRINFLGRSYRIYLIDSLVMMAAVAWIGTWIPRSVLGTVIQALIGMAIYAAGLIVTREELCMKVLSKIRRKPANA